MELPPIKHTECSCLQGKDAGASCGLDRIFYALEIFSENLEEKLSPFVGELMARLIAIMDSPAAPPGESK